MPLLISHLTHMPALSLLSSPHSALLSMEINLLAQWVPIGGSKGRIRRCFLGVGTCRISGAVPGLWMRYLSGVNAGERGSHDQ